MAHGLTLRVLYDVRVHVHRDADLRVPEDLHHDARRDSGRGKKSGRAMASVVQPDDADAGRLGDAREGAVDIARLNLTTGDVRRFLVRLDELTGVYKNTIRGIVALVFRCKPVGGTERTSSESTAVD